MKRRGAIARAFNAIQDYVSGALSGGTRGDWDAGLFEAYQRSEHPRTVMLESPYAAKDGRSVQDHVDYARKCMLDSLRRGEAPFPSHLLYTQVLDDLEPHERSQGLDANFAWADSSDALVCYVDYGISDGMARAIDNAAKSNTPIEYRKLEQ